MMELTSYEMLDVGRSFLDASAVSFTRGLALGSTYLVVAYRAGKQLTTLQVSIINVAFLLFCGQALMAALVEWQYGDNLVRTADQGGVGVMIEPLAHTGLVMTIVSVVALGACLLFMWSVRHPKTQ